MADKDWLLHCRGLIYGEVVGRIILISEVYCNSGASRNGDSVLVEGETLSGKIDGDTLRRCFCR